MLLEHLNEFLIPWIIMIAETMGILIIGYTLLKNFLVYILQLFHKNLTGCDHLQEDLAEGMSTALEFLMGAEILKTVSVPGMQELTVLGVIILMRVALSLLIHFELNQEEKRHRLAAEHSEAK